MLNLKGYHGHHGLEGYRSFETYNLGSQVPNSVLLAKAMEVGADAVLVSQTVTQQNLHVHNLTELVEMVEAEGMRGRMILACGGPRVSNELAKELGYDAGFSKGTEPQHLATFIARELAARVSRPAEPMTLGELTSSNRRVALVGLAKNTGKTVALTALLRELQAAGRSVGVTSVGRDGEERDVIDSRIDKPRVHLPAGSIVATTDGLLRASAIPHELLEEMACARRWGKF